MSLCKVHLPYMVYHPDGSECPLCIPEVQMALFEHEKMLLDEQQRQFELQFYKDKRLFESQLNTLKEEFPFLKPQFENLLAESEKMVYKENRIIKDIKKHLFCGIHGVQLNLVDLSCFACNYDKMGYQGSFEITGNIHDQTNAITNDNQS